jgi:FG-GAP repeat
MARSATPEIAFPRIEHAVPLPGFPGERPGGGPLAPGDDVALSDLYPAADLQPGQEFGLFVVADGADLNPGFVFDGSGELEFVNTTAGGPANIADDAAAIELRHVADDGTVRTVAGPAFHTADNDPDRLENNLNPGGAERVVSGADPASGALLLGFEDAGDFDFDDVVLDLGAPCVVPPPIVTPPASLAELDGINGFRLDGIQVGDLSGRSVASAEDFNGDGFGDLIISAPRAAPNGISEAGQSYVVFGRASGFSASLDLATLDGANGFRLDGIDPFDRSGYSVAGAGAGDVNGDGLADVVIGAHRGASDGYGAGESYVVFGRASGFGATLDLAILDGTNGFRLDGIDSYDHSGYSVASAGDVNGDGLNDLIVGTQVVGESYVVFGRVRCQLRPREPGRYQRFPPRRYRRRRRQRQLRRRSRGH